MNVMNEEIVTYLGGSASMPQVERIRLKIRDQGESSASRHTSLTKRQWSTEQLDDERRECDVSWHQIWYT